MLTKEPKVSVSQNTTRICAALPKLSMSFSTVEDKATDLGFKQVFLPKQSYSSHSNVSQCTVFHFLIVGGFVFCWFDVFWQ